MLPLVPLPLLLLFKTPTLAPKQDSRDEGRHFPSPLDICEVLLRLLEMLVDRPRDDEDRAIRRDPDPDLVFSGVVEAT